MNTTAAASRLNPDKLKANAIATLIENCKLTGINPHVWLTDTLTKLAGGHPANVVGELVPWTPVV